MGVYKFLNNEGLSPLFFYYYEEGLEKIIIELSKYYYLIVSHPDLYCNQFKF